MAAATKRPNLQTGAARRHSLNRFGPTHRIPDPRIDSRTPISNRPPKSIATPPATNAHQSIGASRLPIRSRASTRATPKTAHKMGQTSNTNIQSRGVEDHPSFVWLCTYQARRPANVAAAQTSSATENDLGETWVGLRACIFANDSAQARRAPDARNGTEALPRRCLKLDWAVGASCE
jgi:hypothetical protein